MSHKRICELRISQECIRFVQSLLFVLPILASTAIGQIELSYSKAKSLTGITAPRLLSDRILIGDDSKPSVSQVAIVRVKTAYKFVEIEASKSLFEEAEATKISETEWLIAGLGRYVVTARAFDPEKGIAKAKIEIVLGGDVPPIPPTPDPAPPKPPTPDPTVPIKEPGFRAVIIYESSEALPAAQQEIMTAKAVSDYMRAKAVRYKGQPEYRVFDQHTDCANDSPILCEAMKRPRASLPWVIVSNGTTGYEGPLPATTKDMLILLKRHGGAE